ncbi:MAG: hypothetical protein AB7O59_02685 [Pirellulales bacterium]
MIHTAIWRRCKWCACATAIGIALAGTGCKRWDLRGHGFEDKSNEWVQKMRPPADESRFSGTDARAREIERNLGVR